MINMKLGVKLIGSFLIVAFIATIIGLTGYYAMDQATIAQDEVAAIRLPGVYALGVVKEAQTAVQRFERVIVYENDSDIFKAQYPQMEEAWKRADGGRRIFEALPRTKEEEKLWKEFVPKWEAWKSSHQEVLALAKKGDLAGAHTLSYGKSRETFSEAEKRLGEIIDLNMKVAKETDAAFDKAASLTKTVLMFLILIGVALAIGLGVLISLSITRSLNKVIAGLTDGANQVSSAAGQVSSSSQQLAEGTSEQASSLEETSSSLEEMSSMTRQNADHANQAKAMMSEANTVVDKVGRHMKDMAGAVADITRSSEETGKIIKTIDEIAFQTNLLALNAAVEAARAGEAGAGFAVVADEVRNLAMRASEAAKNTNNLIENTIKAVRKGNDLTKATQEAFQENAEIAKKIGQLVDEIATASEEQSHGIAQVGRAVAEMDKVTQSTAANAEESAAASEELSAQAEQMKLFVGDLIKVVGGSGSNFKGGRKGVRTRAGREPAAARKTLALPAGTTGGPSATPGKPAKKVRTPEEVIPMNEGEFKDF